MTELENSPAFEISGWINQDMSEWFKVKRIDNWWWRSLVNLAGGLDPNKDNPSD